MKIKKGDVFKNPEIDDGVLFVVKNVKKNKILINKALKGIGVFGKEEWLEDNNKVFQSNWFVDKKIEDLLI